MNFEKPLNVFLSYRHEDDPALFREFRNQLKALQTEKLNADDSETVKNLLSRFLQRKAAEGADSSPGLEFVKRDIAADLNSQDKPPTRDYVFLSFLLNRKPRLQDLEAPSWLRSLLYPDGLPILRLRRELWLAAVLIIVGLVYGGVESYAQVHDAAVWQPRIAPAAVAAQPSNNLSARALDVAAARLGQPAGEDFASMAFDQAVPFAAPRGMQRAGTVRPGVIFKPNAGSTASVVEQVTNGGLIMFELFEGQLRGVFRSTNEAAGSFMEIEEAPFAGTWTQTDAPQGSPPMRLKISQTASHFSVWLSYTNVFRDRPFGQGNIQGNKASWTLPQECAPIYQKPGYDYTNPGQNTFVLELSGSVLTYTQETNWTSPCDGHPIGTERIINHMKRSE